MPAAIDISSGVKVCTTCKASRPLDAFHLRHDATRQRATYRSTCKDCERERSRAAREAWRDANRERVRESDRRRKRRVYPDYQRAWARANREMIANRNARAKARKLGVVVEDFSYRDVLARDGMHCYLCDAVVSPDDLSFDHVVPLTRGGPHTLGNVRVAHLACNIRKGNKLVGGVA